MQAARGDCIDSSSGPAVTDLLVSGLSAVRIRSPAPRRCSPDLHGRKNESRLRASGKARGRAFILIGVTAGRLEACPVGGLYRKDVDGRLTDLRACHGAARLR